nr:MAG TPA: hypothetical protein [Caudoviricetes sp.]
MIQAWKSKWYFYFVHFSLAPFLCNFHISKLRLKFSNSSLLQPLHFTHLPF